MIGEEHPLECSDTLQGGIREVYVMRNLAFIVIVIVAIIVQPLQVFADEEILTIKNPDCFYDDRFDEAVTVYDSQFFDIGYRVTKVPAELQTVEGVWTIQYELTLTNKTDKLLDNLSFAAHFPESMQMVLAVPRWYNEPVNVGVLDESPAAATVIYTWEPFVLLPEVGMLPEISVREFYEMLIEISWNGGNEIIHLDMASVNIPEIIANAVQTEYAPFDEMELMYMIERSSEIVCSFE